MTQAYVALEISQHHAMGYVGPTVLRVIARNAKTPWRPANRHWHGGAVTHNPLYFRALAIDSFLDQRISDQREDLRCVRRRAPDHGDRNTVLLLAKCHQVTLFEGAATLGGHTHTVEVEDRGRQVPIDTGFIVYNAINYPNLVALFEHLGVTTVPSNRSFAASLRNGALEYAGTDLRGLFAQPIKVRRRF